MIIGVVLLVLVLGGALFIVGMPGFVIAKRRGLRNPGVAFIPWVGLWIILFESMRRSGWLALIVFVPSLGFLLLCVWTAIEVPRCHKRSQWWTLALIVPLLNLVGYWVYAFTLERDTGPDVVQPAIA